MNKTKVMENNVDNVVALADVCEVLQGKNVDKKKTNDRGEGLPIVVGASDLIQGRFVPKRWCSEKLNYPVFSEEGDIIISVVGTLGKIGINTDGPAILSKHVCALRPKSGVSRQYLMAVVSRLLLDAIPDTTDEVVLGFQSKVDVDVLKTIRFTLPELLVQEWLVSRLTSIATMILACKGKKEDFLSRDGIISVIEQERKEQRAYMRKLSEKLSEIAGMLENLPQDSETLQMIADYRGMYSRLLKIQ
jgi:hypothetical protein|nr:MAG TPA_asm: hypothetical protein [Caudoviricetes sp.]